MSQNNWWWCNKCQGLWFAGNPTSVCPAGDAHTQAGSGVYELPNSGSGQSNWRWCNLCQGLFFVGNNTLGVCPAHSHSDAGSGDYVLSTSGSGQSNWRWCSKCQGLWFAGNPTSVCPAGGAHTEVSSGDYVLAAGLGSSNNAILVDNCQNLHNLTLTMTVTEDLVTLGDTGFSLQLNCYPQIGSKSPNATPQTGDSTLTWFQYIVIVANNQVTWQMQYWANNAHSYQEGPPKIYWPPGYPPTGNPPNTTPFLPVPGGSVITIALATDTSGNVTGATFSITEPIGGLHAASTNPWNQYAGVPEPPQYALYPIYGFTINLVGPPSANCTFTSGAGKLTYSVSQGTIAVQDASTACGGLQPPTAEQSNAVYGDITPSSGSTVSQTFRVASISLGDPAVLYATGANNQQHVFCQGSDNGIYHVFYDPGDNKIPGPERWATNAAGDPASLYATAANNQQHVFYRGTDCGIYNVFYDPGDNKIHGPERWATCAAGDPASLYATAANNQQHVFYRGTDGGIYNVFYDPGDNKIHSPERWATNAAGDPASLYATAANNQQHVFYRGTDGGIYNVFYDPGDNKIHGPERWA
jgi:hypothetical protein